MESLAAMYDKGSNTITSYYAGTTDKPKQKEGKKMCKPKNKPKGK